MPTYIFRNTKTEEITEEFMTFSAREEYLKNNPELAIVIQSPMIVSSVSTSNSKASKVPTGFGEVLSKVAEAHPTSVVGERYGKKSIKEIKTRDIVKSHVKKLTRLAKK